jgi:hypothetical protein
VARDHQNHLETEHGQRAADGEPAAKGLEGRAAARAELERGAQPAADGSTKAHAESRRRECQARRGVRASGGNSREAAQIAAAQTAPRCVPSGFEFESQIQKIKYSRPRSSRRSPTR